MNRLGISISGLFVLALLLYIPTWMEESPEATDNAQVNALTPAYLASNLTTAMYDKDGKLNHKVFATGMEHYDLLGFVLFQNPQYTVYVDDSQSPWQVTAKEGTLYDNNLIQLESDVVITNLSEDDFVQTIKTDFIEIDLERKTMTSDQPVIIMGAQYVINSNGFNANLRTRQYELIDHVQTSFAPGS